MPMVVYSERLVRVEEQVNDLRNQIEKVDDKIDNLDTKLDSLIELRNKGAGVLWVLSGLIGTGIVGGIIELFHWFGIGVK